MKILHSHGHFNGFTGLWMFYVDVLCGSVVNLIVHWSIETFFFAKLTLDKDDVAVF